jgi:S1-C subfamily serine protease
VRVVRVYPNSPAAAIGIRPKDTITSVDGRRMRSTHQLRSQLEAAMAGRRDVTVGVRRRGGHVTFKVSLAAEKPPVDSIDHR